MIDERKLILLTAELDKITALQQQTADSLRNLKEMHGIEPWHIEQIDRILIEYENNMEFYNQMVRSLEELKPTYMECVYVPPNITKHI